MRILLIGNYEQEKPMSMLRYANLLQTEISARGHQVDIVQPSAHFGKLNLNRFTRKWLAYIDKYAIFPFTLSRISTNYDVVHICDHGGSVYRKYLKKFPTSITCHDVYAIQSAQGEHPGNRVSFTGRIFQDWIRRNLIKMKYVACVSDSTKRDFLKLPGRADALVQTITHPVDPIYTPASQEQIESIRAKFGMEPGRDYFLSVGSNNWRKNRKGSVRILKHLIDAMPAEKAPHLVIVGMPWSADVQEVIDQNGLAKSVIAAVHPSDEELRALYSGAFALLFPSFFEGFGWPIIEAESCGCPVITSDIPPMSEIAGPTSSLLIDPNDEPGTAKAILDNWERLCAARPEAISHAQLFNMDTVMGNYIRFFESVHERANSKN